MWTPEGKNGLWVWYDEGNWLDVAAQNGMQYILLKAGDGGYDFNGGQFNSDVVQRVHDAGLGCMAWTYCYLDNPHAEAQNAIEAVRRGADGIMLDVEYEAIGKFNQAQQLVEEIRAGVGDTFVGYAPDFRIAFGNRWPNVGFNPDAEPFPWEAFNALDGVFPQLYWTDFAQPPLLTLELANQWVRGCQSRGWPVPKVYLITPCTATAEDTSTFLQEAVRQQFAGANLWRWNWGNHIACTQAMGAVSWPIEETSPPDPEPTPEPEPTIDPADVLRTYIGEMGSPDGSVVTGFDKQLAAKAPNKAELRNVRNRLVSLYKEALGK